MQLMQFRRLAKITYPSYVVSISYSHPYPAIALIDQRLDRRIFLHDHRYKFDILQDVELEHEFLWVGNP